MSLEPLPLRIPKAKAGNSMRRMPVRSAVPAVDTSSPVSQAASPLFGLPAELRNRIYDYLFGAGTIHVRLRHCSASSRHLLREEWEAPEKGELAVDIATKWKDVTQYSKLSYAVCNHPDQWDRAYKLSRTAEEDRPDSRDAGDRAREHYSYAHSDCTSMVEYLAAVDTNSLQVRSEPEELTSERLAQSAVHLNILQTCRQIYREAWRLPFDSYTFDIPFIWLNDFATRILYPHQAALIETIHVRNIWEALAFKQIARSFPHLKKVSISNEACMPLIGSEQEWRTFFNFNTLETVEIMMGSNREDAEQKAWFAAKCDLMEQFLVRPKSDEERAERAEYAKIIGKMPNFGIKFVGEYD
ncbi:hypothetical protein CLAFUR0_12677 [Fulvia fulva]|nr:hypothetical protein CLAFUR0_12677 [Fulvia fulva]